MEVPGVVGLTRNEAKERLAGAGFEFGVRPREISEEDKGKVLEQSVAAGKKAQEGSTILLAVGVGSARVVVPDIEDASLAKGMIARAGLRPGSWKEDPNASVPAGVVIEQDPVEGSKVEPGTPVDLVVSTGPAKTSIPEVSGLSVEEAARILTEAGCTVTDVIERPSSRPSGTVVGTDPPIGTSVQEGTPVTIIASGGGGGDTPSFFNGGGGYSGDGGSYAGDQY